MTSSDENPSVTVGGVEYPVPPIAFREVSKILPLVNKVFTGMRSSEISEEVIEGLGKIIFYGIQRGTPTLTYEAFIDRPGSVSEMMTAALTVCKQAGLKTKDAPPGEAPGETIPPTFRS